MHSPRRSLVTKSKKGSLSSVLSNIRFKCYQQFNQQKAISGISQKFDNGINRGQWTGLKMHSCAQHTSGNDEMAGKACHGTYRSLMFADLSSVPLHPFQDIALALDFMNQTDCGLWVVERQGFVLFCISSNGWALLLRQILTSEVRFCHGMSNLTSNLTFFTQSDL